MAGETLEQLRSKYLAIGCMLSAGSRLAGRYEGNRVFFVVACNGEMVIVFDTLGNKIKGRRSDFILHSVYDEEGRPSRYEIDEETGHIHIFKGLVVDETGEECERWIDKWPWAKYDSEFDFEVKNASCDTLKAVDHGGDFLEMDI